MKMNISIVGLNRRDNIPMMKHGETEQERRESFYVWMTRFNVFTGGPETELSELQYQTLGVPHTPQACVAGRHCPLHNASGPERNGDE